MLNNLTGESLKAYFQSCSKEKGKIYLASAQDDELAQSVADFFVNGGMEVDFVQECVDVYLESNPDIGVTLRDFVIKLSKTSGFVRELRKDKKEVEDMMRRTKERMEGHS